MGLPKHWVPSQLLLLQVGSPILFLILYDIEPLFAEIPEPSSHGRSGSLHERLFFCANFIFLCYTLKMSTMVMYRRYRPTTFKDVVGQDHVVEALERSIKNKTIGHAYLFAGGRGTGKTSVARIFASEIGCTEKDLYEMDAASNRGIDDVRAIRDAVSTMPFESPYKVYIIDEAHMLTKEAFNALLKTLEEPPPHAVFILATTEAEKIPETVVSRCQTFNFKKPTQKILRETRSVEQLMGAH